MARTFGKIAVTILLSHLYIVALTQTGTPFTSAYNTGLLDSDHFSIDRSTFALQPALLARLESPIASGNIQSLFTGFNIHALGLHIASAIPGHSGVGLSLMSLGHPDYKASEIFMGVARRIGLYTSIGIGQSFHTTKVANEGRPWSGSSSIGVVYDNNSWGLSFKLDGLMRWNKSINPDKLSAESAAYIRVLTQTSLYFSLVFVDNKLRPVTGIRQKMIYKVEIIGSFQWYPARYGMGFMIPLADQLDSIVSTTYHPVLGWSPSLGLQWRGKKTKKD